MIQPQLNQPLLVASLLAALCLETSCQTVINNESINLKQRQQLGQLLTFHETQTLAERVSAIPNSLLKTWRDADSKLNPIALTYQNYTPSLAEQEILKKSLVGLPEAWQKVLQKKVVRIFFVENLIGAGITDWVLKGKNDQRFYTIILNPKLFHTSAKAWLEYRANSMFKQGDYRITYIGIPDIPAVTYALLHEAAHIIDFENYQTPFVDPFMQQYLNITTKETPFIKHVWLSYDKPLKIFEFPERKQLNAYHLTVQRGYISNDKLPEILKRLKHTPFVTPYASLTWAEDFADFSAFSHLERMGETPLHLQLKNGKETIVDITPLSSPINQARLLSIAN